MSFNEWGIIGGAVGVIIGVALEGWEHWDDFKKKGWKPIIPKIGFAILVVSLAVEIVFDARLAKESADTQLETANIEKEYGPRKLTDQQLVVLAKEAQPFAGETAIFSFNAGDAEAAVFGSQIGRTLEQSAGWKIGAFAAVLNLGGLKIGLEMTCTQDEKSRKAAATLAAEFTKDGFPVPLPSAEPDTPQFGHRTGKVWITVGAKPLGLTVKQSGGVNFENLP